MYELVQVGANTFYMECPAKVGFYRTAPDEAVLIDSGSDRDAGKRVKKILDAQGWRLKAIFNTHSHADHIGGNRFLQERTGCAIYAPGLDCCGARYPVLEPGMLYGAKPMRELCGKFLMAQASDAEPLTDAALPTGLTSFPLPGHSYDMVGYRTADDVVFLADCVSSAETLEKYAVTFLWDVRAQLETLERVRTLRAACFVPSHAGVTGEIAPLAQKNIDNTLGVAETVLGLLAEPKTFEELLRDVFLHYGITMTLQQNMLIGSILRTYLSYLKDEGRAAFYFEDNRMLWRAEPEEARP